MIEQISGHRACYNTCAHRHAYLPTPHTQRKKEGSRWEREFGRLAWGTCPQASLGYSVIGQYGYPVPTASYEPRDSGHWREAAVEPASSRKKQLTARQHVFCICRHSCTLLRCLSSSSFCVPVPSHPAHIPLLLHIFTVYRSTSFGL